MKKKFNVMAVCVLLSSSILFSSCIGSFSLWNKLLDWNNTVGDKFINELVFVALCIVPVYEIAWLADILVLNSIEFWSGENPVLEGSIKKVEGTNGIYTIETKKDGYHIEKEGSGETVDFRFNKSDKSWSIESGDKTTKLLKILNNEEVVMYLPNGAEMQVPLNQAGVFAYKQVLENSTYFASK